MRSEPPDAASHPAVQTCSRGGDTQHRELPRAPPPTVLPLAFLIFLFPLLPPPSARSCWFCFQTHCPLLSIPRPATWPGPAILRLDCYAALQLCPTASVSFKSAKRSWCSLASLVHQDPKPAPHHGTLEIDHHGSLGQPLNGESNLLIVKKKKKKPQNLTFNETYVAGKRPKECESETLHCKAVQSCGGQIGSEGLSCTPVWM